MIPETEWNERFVKKLVELGVSKECAETCTEDDLDKDGSPELMAEMLFDYGKGIAGLLQ